MTGPIIQLSRFIRPLLYVGDQQLSNQNMTAGEDRLAYLSNLIRHLNNLLNLGTSFEDVRKFRDRAPFGEWLVHLEPGEQARAISQAEDALSFRPERLVVMLADGRKRDTSEMCAFATGRETDCFAHMLSALARGIQESALEQLSAEIELDSELVESLVERGVLERRGGVDTPVAATSTQASFVRWLGHAWAVFGCGSTSVWVDPLSMPRLAWRENEEAEVFSPTYPDSELLDPYSPATQPVTVMDLPPPRAVFITHPDTDHFDLGTLMLLPEETLFVVPRVHPSSRFDVDLRQVIRNVLGDRRVVALGHGETLDLGDLRVTAFPFSGEVPTAVEHAWNCYLVRGRDGAAAFCADSAIAEPQLEFLTAALQSHPDPLVLFGRARLGRGKWPGYRDAPTELYNMYRGWPWYTPVWSLFAPVPAVGIEDIGLSSLADQGLRWFFPYATGCTPWHRLTARPLAALVDSLTMNSYMSIRQLVAGAGIRIPALRYSQVLALDTLHGA
jgi:L-ascorbate metabolism protein UlaG (beta-lactamase superfamily)